MLKIYIIVCLAIFALSYTVLTIKIATWPEEYRKQVNLKPIGMLIQSFVPVINIFVLTSPFRIKKEDLIK